MQCQKGKRMKEAEQPYENLKKENEMKDAIIDTKPHKGWPHDPIGGIEAKFDDKGENSDAGGKASINRNKEMEWGWDFRVTYNNGEQSRNCIRYCPYCGIDLTIGEGYDTQKAIK